MLQSDERESEKRMRESTKMSIKKMFIQLTSILAIEAHDEL